MDITKIQHNFCQNVRYMQSKYNLTQKEMAQILGVSISTLRKMEMEENKVRLNSDMLHRICDCFDLSADVFLNEQLEHME